jgi:cyclomaltodextrinase / maltogenic alpha-amylase / neopullulanase
MEIGKFFYHIYPLGLCAAPRENDFSSPPLPRLDRLYPWLDHLQWLGADALYLGPLFESSTHGYDTADYYHLDRRLGTDQTLSAFSAGLHRRGLRLVLDGVFNHVGRHFWAFRDLLANGESSPYRDWFAGVRFDAAPAAPSRRAFGDRFAYEGWNGHFELVKLNLANPRVRSHLLGAVESWIQRFQIDGLRLDTADCLDFDFMAELSAFCRRLKPGFWLMGEVIHGDYRRWTAPGLLDSVTNYECYKGLWSSLNDRNYFEIAYALNRQSGPGGLYAGRTLYTFADNHDVERAASRLEDPAHLPLLYALLFSMPGLPSIYYGSEWGLPGRPAPASDAPLRPALDLPAIAARPPHPGLAETIARLATLRRDLPALREGSYHELHVASQQLAFLRQSAGQRVVVALNAAPAPAQVPISLPGASRLVDRLDSGAAFPLHAGACSLPLPPCSARILAAE